MPTCKVLGVRVFAGERICGVSCELQRQGPERGMMRKMREAARKGRAEANLRKTLGELGLEGSINLRELEGQMSATILLSGRDPDLDDADIEEKLAAAAGMERVTLIRTSHGGASEKAPAAPPRASGGHSDPLSLGTKPQQRPEPSRPEGVKFVIAVASGKGGVGKSTVAANLALGLSARGMKVGLLDLDIHGPSLPVLFPYPDRLRGEDGKVLPAEIAGLKLVSLGYMVDERQAVAWRGPMVMNAARQLIDDVRWGELDVLVVDTPPGTGDAHLSMIQRLKLDAAVLVATPSPLATADVRRGASLFEKAHIHVAGLVLNMTGGPFGDDLDDDLLAELKLEILDRLPVSVDAAQVPLNPERSILLSGTIDHVFAALQSVAGDSSA